MKNNNDEIKNKIYFILIDKFNINIVQNYQHFL